MSYDLRGLIFRAKKEPYGQNIERNIRYSQDEIMQVIESLFWLKIHLMDKIVPIRTKENAQKHEKVDITTSSFNVFKYVLSTTETFERSSRKPASDHSEDEEEYI